MNRVTVKDGFMVMVLLLAAGQWFLIRCESSAQGRRGGIFFLAAVDNGDEVQSRNSLIQHLTVGFLEIRPAWRHEYLRGTFPVIAI
jgi:hypothetical protein